MKKDLHVKKDPWNFDGNKLLWHMDRIHEHYDRGQPIPPIHIDAGITKQCQARCVYCYGIFQTKSQDSIPPELVIKFMRDAPILGIKSLTLTGDGENTLNPGLWEGLVKGKAGGLDIGLATNGIALDRDKMVNILSSCTWCRFNTSAVDQVGYKSIHGIDAWHKVQDNIKQMVALKKQYGFKCTLGLQMVLIPQCVDQVLPEAWFALRNKLDYFVIKQFSDPGDERLSRFNLDWYEDPKVMSMLKKAQTMSTDKTYIVPKWKRLESKGRRAYDHCVDCPLLFQISGDGKCYPCGYLFGNPDYCYGDLVTQDLREILTSNQYWSVITYMRETFDVHKDCVGCCRHDSTNEFVHRYLNPPEHLNFI